MRISIHDGDALRAVSPTALSACARAAGWRRHEPYRVHSDTYIGEDRPEIIVPRTERLGLCECRGGVDRHVRQSGAAGRDDGVSVAGDRGPRCRSPSDREIQDGSVTLNDGVDLIGGARDMLLAAACSLGESKAVYRAGANRSATDLLAGVRLGQTAQGSFVVSLLTRVRSGSGRRGPMSGYMGTSERLGQRLAVAEPTS